MNERATGWQEELAVAQSLTDVLRLVTAGESEHTGGPSIRIGLSANVTTELLSVFLRKHGLLAGIRAEVEQGNFDSPLENAKRFAAEGVDILLLMQLFDGLAPGFEVRSVLLPDAEVEAHRARFERNIRLVLEASRDIRSVLISTMHRVEGFCLTGTSDRTDAIIARFNETIRTEAANHANVRVLDLAPIVSEIGRERAINLRFHYRARAPYSAAFCDAVARSCFLATRGGGRYYYKALVLDCDNTIWGGVIGEDLLGGIALGPDSYPGCVFYEIQCQLLRLQRQGVILNLCSKNNAADVDEVFMSHPSQVLRSEHLIVKAVNWRSKTENLRSIAESLNIGLESMIFLDDSPFECAAVREQLPMVRVFQVPAALYNYPALVREIGDLLLGGVQSSARTDKTSEYHIRQKVMEERAQYASEQEYLMSLGLQVHCVRNEMGAAGRISELTQKSNQFNLTTRRYTETEIVTLMQDPMADVYSLHVSDKFGKSGLTGVVIVKTKSDVAEVEAFLLSCRVIGRGIEFACWAGIAADARRKGCKELHASFTLTGKNKQVEDFYDRLGLTLAEVSDSSRRYAEPLEGLALTPPEHVEVIHV